MERIRGGWPNVPDNLKTKTMLNREGLKPGAEPVAEVWGGNQWYKLYDVAAAVPKRKLSDKQREASVKSLEKARSVLTCSECGEILKMEKLSKQLDGTRICDWCQELNTLQAKHERMITEGRERFRKWYEHNFVILDTETTDIDGEIVEIGIIDRSGTVLFHSLVKPIYPVADDSPATKIHGITNAELENAPTWADIRDAVQAVVRGKLVLTYNADFDLTMVNHSCSRNGVPRLHEVEKWDCVMEAYRMTQGSERWISLANASGQYTAHRAIDDCLATLAVIEEQWEHLELIPASEGIA